MARPRITVGSFGDVKLTPQVKDSQGRWITAPAGATAQRWKARTKYRDVDGVVRDVTKFAATKAKATAALREVLVERVAPTPESDGLRRDMTLLAAGELWLERISRPGTRLSPNTIVQYRGTFDRLVRGSQIAALTLGEVNRVPVLERFLQNTAEGHGAASAKTARSVVSSILSLAVRHDVLDGNRMRDVENPTVEAKPKARIADRAFTLEELTYVLGFFETNQTAIYYDLVDLAHFLAGTGARHSEALGLRWDDVELTGPDGEPLEVGIARIRGTKTAGSDRKVPMPAWLTTRLRNRLDVYGSQGLVFRTPGRWHNTNSSPGTSADTGVSISVSIDTPRDRRNVTRHFRRILDEAGMEWATAHTFRTTVGDLVTKRMSGTDAANVLGHARASMTYDRYGDRHQPAHGASIVLAGVSSRP